jgi:hypothetical protein
MSCWLNAPGFPASGSPSRTRRKSWMGTMLKTRRQWRRISSLLQPKLSSLQQGLPRFLGATKLAAVVELGGSRARDRSALGSRVGQPGSTPTATVSARASRPSDCASCSRTA